MPEFVCRVGTPSGEVRVETHVAPDEAGVRADLQRRDLHVFEVKPRGFALPIGRFRIGGQAKKVPRRQFLLFNQQMVALVRAGLPLLQALDVVLERMPEGAFKVYLRDVRDRVKSGSALSDAFIAQGEAFPRVYAASLTAGERSGELATVMNRFLEFARKTERVRTRVRSALVYPAVLSVLSCGLVSILMFYVLPKFASFYGDFDAKVPAITRFVVGIATFLRSHWVIIVLGVVSSWVAFSAWRETPRGRLLIDRFLLRLPILGEVVRMYNVSTFSRTLSTLLSGGIPLLSSLQTTTTGLDNGVYVAAVTAVTDDVREGRALWDSLDRTHVFTDLAIELVKVGESTGSLDVMLVNVADFYDEQVDEMLTRVVSLFEPILLVVMGFVVGFLLLAMYLPIFNLSNVVD